VAVPLAGARPPADGPCDGHPYCDARGVLCTCSLNVNDGTTSIVCEGECETEGEEEEGDTGCVSGELYVCTEESCTLCEYRCVDGGWELIGCEEVPIQEGDYSFACLFITEDEWYCWTLPGNETPCEDMNWGAAGIQCLGEYGLSVSVSIPCQRVERVPYPRGMVLVPNRMEILPGGETAEAWSNTLDYNACLSYDLTDGERAIRNYRIGLKWQRIDWMPPYWEVEESGSYYGSVVGNIIWDHSSWGKPECGPGLQPGERLPAFRVRVYTYWQAFWRRIYERQKTITECTSDWRCGAWGECNTVCDLDGDGNKDEGTAYETRLCGADSDGMPDDECWETVDSGWQPFDLRMFGYPTSYFVSSAAGPVPTSLEPNPPCSGLCVPVVEVQGVIRNPRGK